MKPEEVEKLWNWAKGEVSIAPDGVHPNFMLDTMRLCVEYAKSEMVNAASVDNIDWVNNWQSLLTKIKEE